MRFSDIQEKKKNIGQLNLFTNKIDLLSEKIDKLDSTLHSDISELKNELAEIKVSINTKPSSLISINLNTKRDTK